MKKKLLIFLFGALMMLSACRPVTPAGQENDQTIVETKAPEIVDKPATAERPTLPPEIPMSPENEPTAAPTGFNSEQSGNEENEGAIPVPPLEWNVDPATLILSGTDCCGFTTRQVVMNYIPTFQLWGDGRMIWSFFPQAGARKVLQAQLTESQIRGLLQRAVDAGFYDWNNRYSNPLIADAADKCITINLIEASKMVCEYFEGAPEAFHNLYAHFGSGADIEGAPYVPDQGFLIAELVAGEITLTGEPFAWSSGDSVESLSKAGAGIWIEGETLANAWEALNENPFFAVFEEGGDRYVISIQIPGLSMMQPEG